MIQITPTIAIDEKDIQFDFVRASGPGGQNVNKVSSATVIRYDVSRLSLPITVHRRLTQLAGKRMTVDGVLIIKGQQYRTQERNRADALVRLTDLIRQAADVPKNRVATKPTRGSQIRTLDAKHRRGEIKQNRRKASDTDE
jgi:ribosome-associated protein